MNAGCFGNKSLILLCVSGSFVQRDTHGRWGTITEERTANHTS